MSTRVYHTLKEVSPGSYNWRIKVRIIRIWRGVSRKGEQFKGFNLLLLDDKNYRLHAFVPAAQADEMGKKFELGNVYKIYNFTVKNYRNDEKFRCIRSEKQIMFTNYTTVEKSIETDSLIPTNAFDFYDLDELKPIANDNTYLTDVIGVIDKEQPLEELINANGMKQVKMQFSITDGRCTIKATFWDSLAKELEKTLKQDLKLPIIIIIASCKIGLWEEAPCISSATATTFYVNYDHHSVANMRKLLSTPLFAKHEFSTQKKEKLEILKVEDIHKLDYTYHKKEIVCQANITTVAEFNPWFIYVCTSCYRQVELVDNIFKCLSCMRRLPYPDKRFLIYTEASDATGNIEIVLFDREVRSLLNKTVDEVQKQEMNENNFPIILKSIENSDYGIKLLITKDNIDKNLKSFKATDIVKGFYDETILLQQETSTDEIMLQTSNTTTYPETSNSTYHLDGLSQLNFQTPEVSKKQGKQKMDSN